MLNEWDFIRQSKKLVNKCIWLAANGLILLEYGNVGKSVARVGDKGVSRGQIMESCMCFAKVYLVSDGESL